jgi:predicted kinase
MQDGARRRETEQHALETLGLAIAYLEPPPPRLIAVGGLSGTGKTTLAAGLAPLLLPAPGALHLRSDVLRKTLAGVGELERLPASAYTPEARARVYTRLAERAEMALRAGHSVVVDAVFAGPDERAMVEEVARRCAARFDGLWLEAAPDLLQARVAARKADASDATPQVVERQLGYDLGEIGWHRLTAAGDPAQVLSRARDVLAIARA